jgi:hypothetical protein
MEVFEPWYFGMPRPVILDAPASVRHGQSFELVIRDGSISRVVIIRTGSVTHGFNSDQRYVGLEFERLANGRLRVYAPPTPWIAPPGHCMIFVLDQSGVPSVGRILRISLAWAPWFSLGPDNFSFPADATVEAVSTRPGGTSLFVVGPPEPGRPGGRVWSKFFQDPKQPNQWSDWFALGDNVFRPGSGVAALSLAEGATSLYVMGLDGKVWSNFFDPRS